MHVLYPMWKLAAFIVGLAMGSFLGVAIQRIPEGRSLVAPPSACDACGARVAWRDNVPIVSWVVLGARCRHCGAPLPALYPLVELLGGLVAWLCFDRFVPGPAFLDGPHLLAFTVFYGACWLLMLAAYTDLRARIIPEVASLWAVPAGIVAAGLLGVAGYDGWLAIGWQQAVLGAAAGGGLLGGMSWLWRHALGRDGLGWGDVRLAAMIGAFVGPLPGLWTVLLLASLGGAALGLVTIGVLRRSTYLPFGPSLAAAGVAYVLWGDAIVSALFPGMAMFL